MIEATLRAAEARIEHLRLQQPATARLDALQGERIRVNTELRRLADAIASGADVEAVRNGLAERQTRLQDIDRELRAYQPTPPLPAFDAALRRRLRDRLREWQQVLSNDPQAGNRLLRDLMPGKIL